jgi:hypothetical protein
MAGLGQHGDSRGGAGGRLGGSKRGGQATVELCKVLVMGMVDLEAVDNSGRDVECQCRDLSPFGENTARTGGAELTSVDARVSKALRILV